MDSFYSRSELEHIGFATIGKNVLLSRKASIYSPAMISIGDNVRIDDFCILSGCIGIGSQVHISAYVALYGVWESQLKIIQVYRQGLQFIVLLMILEEII